MICGALSNYFLSRRCKGGLHELETSADGVDGQDKRHRSIGRRQDSGTSLQSVPTAQQLHAIRG